MEGSQTYFTRSSRRERGTSTQSNGHLSGQRRLPPHIRKRSISQASMNDLKGPTAKQQHPTADRMMEQKDNNWMEKQRAHATKGLDGPWNKRMESYTEFYHRLRSVLLKYMQCSNIRGLDLLVSNAFGESNASIGDIFKEGPIILAPPMDDNGDLNEEEMPAPHSLTVYPEPAQVPPIVPSLSINEDTDNNPEASIALDGGSKKSKRYVEVTDDASLDSSDQNQGTANVSPPAKRQKTDDEPMVTKTTVVRIDSSDSYEDKQDRCLEYSDIQKTLLSLRAEELSQRARSVAPASPKSHIRPKAAPFDVNRELRDRVKRELGSSTVRWPVVGRSHHFPDCFLIFPKRRHQTLADKHERYWNTFASLFLEIAYYHPTNLVERRSIQRRKTEMLRRQATLLSDYIETLGIECVAREMCSPDAANAFFFLKRHISLNDLSEEELQSHLSYLRHEPWLSPIIHRHRSVWWHMLMMVQSNGIDATRQETVVYVSDAAKAQIANAHYNGTIQWDKEWMALAGEQPWKQMINDFYVPNEELPRRQVTTMRCDTSESEAHLASVKVESKPPVSNNKPVAMEKKRTVRGKLLKFAHRGEQRHGMWSDDGDDDDDDTLTLGNLAERLRTRKGKRTKASAKKLKDSQTRR